ncbi:MAG: ATP-binding cassette domain-containing protein, partial [Nitrosomonas sp.]|nr:ATP-binding cassette domain-containing protein [Nitrosomonas sp.]
HRYKRERDERNFTLGPLNLTLQPGEVVFITGGNGSGKSTLGLLLVGLYSPESGQITLNDEVVCGESLEYYRQQFSVVFSDFYLFESLLGLVKADLDERAQAYLNKLQLDHKVKVENGIFSTIELSQGQRKRLALVTAYLEDRPFYVFDEWAADQDPLFKELFYTTLLADLKARGKTVVVITHDDHYFHLADRCIRLENGQSLESQKTQLEPVHATCLNMNEA